ncbi:putative ribonuclease H-like domain-containing protein [Tanacetum coccineum]
MPPTPDLSFTGLDEFVNKHVVENYKAMSSKEEPKVVRKYDDALSIEEWVSDDEKEDVSQPKTEKKTVRPSVVKKEFGNPQMDLQDKGVIDSGCSRHITGNLSYLTNYEEIDGGYVAFGENPKRGKIIGKVKGNLVRGLPSKLFENDQTCVACQKGKQHRASCKSKTKNSISLPLHLLHMDLFRPTFVKILKKKMYCLVVTDDYSRFTWVFFLATKDETSGILKSFITGIENLVDHKVKVHSLMVLQTADSPFSQDPKSSHDDGSKPSSDDGKKVDEDPRKDSKSIDQEKEDNVNRRVADRSQEPEAHNEDTQRNLKFTSEDQVRGGLLGIIVNRLKSGSYRVKSGRHIYVDDIIFGSTKKELCIAFEKLMHEKFQMSSMGELTFFLGLQVKQKKDGIFISQDKYVE